MADFANLPPPRLSRYRSIRQAQAKVDQQIAIAPQESSSSGSTDSCQLSRTPSRYRRPATMPAFAPRLFPSLKIAKCAPSHGDDDSSLSSPRDEDSTKNSDPNSSISEFHPGYRSGSHPEKDRLLHPPIPEDDLKEPAAQKELHSSSTVPSTHVPIFAPNEDTREAVIEHGSTQMKFKVTPRTTPLETITHASRTMSDRIRPKSSVLLESFQTVGVQRPVRLYENINHIMNSWDADGQNSFILLDPGTGTIEPELTLPGAPPERPTEMSWILHYSQKPGKWDKRAVTLQSDGRITIRKDIHKPQDAVSICHLSDFDIYRPSQEKSRTKIKPPKKFCFAVKSQQKTAVFESTLDFVHFFCTDDKSTAKSFYTAVQAWRSWYLVHVLRVCETEAVHKNKTVNEGSHADRSKEVHSAQSTFANTNTQKEETELSSRSNRFHSTSNSIEFAKSSNQFNTTISPERRGGAVLKPRRNLLSKPDATILKDDEPLANIGQKLSTSRSASNTRESTAKPLLQENTAPSPSTSTSTSALNRHQSHRIQHHPSTLANTQNLQKQPSTRTKERPKPLVDLTPQYQPPPQHARKGRPFIPDTVGEGGLIENATSPEDPLGVPSSTVRRFGSLSIRGGAGSGGKTSTAFGKLRHAQTGVAATTSSAMRREG